MGSIKHAVSLFCIILFWQIRCGNAYCTDNSQHCGYWAGRGECTRNPRYMRVNCRKSCNLCVLAAASGVITCNYVTCTWAQWSAWSAECGRASRQRKIIEKRYRTSRTSCAGLVQKCNQRPQYQTRDNPCNCADRNAYCRDWAGKGECQRNPRYMTVNCRKSCNLCRKAERRVTCNYVTCSWGQWGSWSSTCGKAMRKRIVIEKKETTTRRRSCKGLKRTCSTIQPQAESRVTSCSCSYVLCLVGDWSNWSSTCGEGRRTRTVEASRRSVMRKNCDGLTQSCSHAKTETRTKNCTCHYLECVYGEWSSWSRDCGTMERKRTLLHVPRNISLQNCNGLNQYCPNKEESETRTIACGVSSPCYADGNTYMDGEIYIEKNCTSVCICNGNSSITCSSLCPSEKVVCGAGEYEVDEVEHVANSNCSCTVRKCVRVDTSINANGCGVSNSSDASTSLFIIGGNDAVFGKWPWMIAVVKVSTPTVIHCGATLLNTQWALSAAHCFSKPFRNDPTQYILRIGEHRLDKKENEVERRIQKIVLHENYTRGTYDNDIALLHFDQPVQYTRLLKPICINDGELNYPPGLNCMVTGWGRTKNELGPYSSILQQLEIPMISHQVCSDTFEKLSTTITQNMVCAGYLAGEKDSCGGDSGGPLMCRTSQGRPWKQVGVVSFGKGCARAGVVGVYTKVGNYKKWVQNHFSNFL